MTMLLDRLARHVCSQRLTADLSAESAAMRRPPLLVRLLSPRWARQTAQRLNRLAVRAQEQERLIDEIVTFDWQPMPRVTRVAVHSTPQAHFLSWKTVAAHRALKRA